MKAFKLIKEYPGSKELGYLLVDTSCFYSAAQPEKYPHLWEEITITDYITTSDGIIKYTGEIIWYIDNKNVRYSYVSEYSTINNIEYYSTSELAHEALYSLIELQIENELVKGENIPLYGVLHSTDLHWQTHKTTSYEVWQRNKRSDKWKYFRSEDKRKEYIEWNKPMFTKHDLLEIVCQQADEYDNALVIVNNYIDGTNNNL